jgi:hypothetical protein
VISHTSSLINATIVLDSSDQIYIRRLVSSHLILRYLLVDLIQCPRECLFLQFTIRIGLLHVQLIVVELPIPLDDIGKLH